jgi:hypothetical protein
MVFSIKTGIYVERRMAEQTGELPLLPPSNSQKAFAGTRQIRDGTGREGNFRVNNRHKQPVNLQYERVA